MPVLQKLESRERVLTLLRCLTDSTTLRDLATRYHITIPGFRANQAPLNLLARAISSSCWKNTALRRGMEAAIERLARPGSSLLAGIDETEAIARFSELDKIPVPKLRPLILAALIDNREPVYEAALALLDRLTAGELHLPPDERPQTRVMPRAPRDDARGGEPPAGARGDRQERSLAKREHQLHALRDECTRQEQKIMRLREQLDAERAAHLETRRALDEERRLRSTGRSASVQETEALAEENQRLVADVLRLKRRVDSLLRDHTLLVSGTRALGETLESLVSQVRAPSTPAVRPHKPTRSVDGPPSGKTQLPTAEHTWPRHFRSFLARLAESPFVERLHPLDCYPAHTSRITLEIPDGMLLAQFSDGEHAARFLIRTTASTPATLLWVRRHLAETYFQTA